MESNSKQPDFYGDAHPELTVIANGDHQYLSRLIGVELAGYALERLKAEGASSTQMAGAEQLKLTMDEILQSYQLEHGIDLSKKEGEST